MSIVQWRHDSLAIASADGLRALSNEAGGC